MLKYISGLCQSATPQAVPVSPDAEMGGVRGEFGVKTSSRTYEAIKVDAVVASAAVGTQGLAVGGRAYCKSVANNETPFFGKGLDVNFYPYAGVQVRRPWDRRSDGELEVELGGRFLLRGYPSPPPFSTPPVFASAVDIGATVNQRGEVAPSIGFRID